MEPTEKSDGCRAISSAAPSPVSLSARSYVELVGKSISMNAHPIELIGRGACIFATDPKLLEALDKCGAGTVDIGVIVYKRITFDLRGDVIAEKPQLQIVTSWDRFGRSC